MTETLKPRGFLSLFFRHAGFRLFFLVVVGGFVGVFGYLSFQEASEFSERGQAVEAEIVSTQLKKWRSGGTNAATQQATVRFLVDGKEIFASARVGDDLFENARPGDAVEILYLPENPRQIEIERGTNWQIVLILGAVAAAVIGLWLLLAVRAFQFARQALHVRNHGSRSQVPVVEHKAPLFTSNKKPKTCLVWRDSAGRECSSLPIPDDQANEYPIGREIAIYELPDPEFISVWEGDVGHARG